MKLSLIVADGVHKGKAIPINAPQFLIGREPHCQLRPASQAISKQHCAVLTKDDKVFVQDFGSTNGTFVNDEKVEGEREVKHGDALQVGPLAFTLNIEATPVKAPVPKTGSSPASVKKSGSDPNVAKAKATDSKPKVESKPKHDLQHTQMSETETTSAMDSDSELHANEADGPRSDRMAALLLGLGDDEPTDASGNPQIPDGSTVMDMPALDANGEPKKSVSNEAAATEKAANSNVASEILKKYMRRPRQ